MRSWSSPRLCLCLEPSSCQLMLTQIYYEPGGANSTELSPCPPWCQTIVVTTRLLMKLFMLGRDTNHWPSMSLAETWICKTISFCKYFFSVLLYVFLKNVNSIFSLSLYGPLLIYVFSGKCLVFWCIFCVLDMFMSLYLWIIFKDYPHSVKQSPQPPCFLVPYLTINHQGDL